MGIAANRKDAAAGRRIRYLISEQVKAKGKRK
jgi:hypothetical protein